MATNKVIVNRKMLALTVELVLSFIMFTVSLICLFIPIANDYSLPKFIVYVIFGGIGTLFFAFVTSRLLFRRMMKRTALVITEKGIYDYTVCGIGAGLIERSCITSIKVMGNANDPMLGITINDPRSIYLKAKKVVADEMKINVQAGLPNIIISSKDVDMPIRELAKTIQTVLNGAESAPVERKFDNESIKNELEKKGIRPITDEEEDDLFAEKDSAKSE